MTSPNDVHQLFKNIESKWGKLDVCINNVGFLKLKNLIDMDISLWKKTIDTNITSCFLSSQHAFKIMSKTQKQSCIVNISSLSGVRACEKFPGMSAYISSKHAVIGLTEAMAVEGKPFNIAVNCVAPGAMNTKFFNDNFPESTSHTDCNDVAEVVLNLTTLNDKPIFSGSIVEIFCND